MAVMTNDGDLLPGCKGLLGLLLKLATEMGDAIDGVDLKTVHLSGAMTNKVYRVSWPSRRVGVETDAERNVLIRVYGEGVDLFFDRDEEIRTFQSLSEHGYGPGLLGQFDGGRVEQFIHARVCFLILDQLILRVFVFVFVFVLLSILRLWLKFC